MPTWVESGQEGLGIPLPASPWQSPGWLSAAGRGPAPCSPRGSTVRGVRRKARSGVNPGAARKRTVRGFSGCAGRGASPGRGRKGGQARPGAAVRREGKDREGTPLRPGGVQVKETPRVGVWPSAYAATSPLQLRLRSAQTWPPPPVHAHVPHHPRTSSGTSPTHDGRPANKEVMGIYWVVFSPVITAVTSYNTPSLTNTFTYFFRVHSAPTMC